MGRHQQYDEPEDLPEETYQYELREKSFVIPFFGFQMLKIPGKTLTMHRKLPMILTALLLFGSILQAQKPVRIVSLAQSLTKNLYYLEAGSQMAGCTSYCNEALADGVEVVATAIDVNIEKTLSLDPDLILATIITPPETIEQLQKMGMKVEVFPTPISFNEICEQFIHLGKLVGNEALAHKIVDETSKKVSEISRKPGNSKTKMFFQIGAQPIFTVVDNTFMSDYFKLTGTINIASNLKHGTMTRESVLLSNPDVIFITSMGLVADEEKNTWMQFKQMNAVEHQKIFVIDAEKACTPTPVTFVETLEEMVKLMQQ